MEIIWIGIYYFFTVGGYFWLSHQATERHFFTPWDKYIPTIPVFIVPYIAAALIYTLFPIFLYFSTGWDKTKPFLIASGIANLIGFLVYYFWNTSVLREPITQSSFFSDILKWIHASDRSSAAFPSGHVYMSVIAGYFCWIYFPTTRPYVLIIVPLVMIATVVLKQHYLPDILGGIVVAAIALFATKFILK
jgi:membrane-associated phospholipid phosphatase